MSNIKCGVKIGHGPSLMKRGKMKRTIISLFLIGNGIIPLFAQSQIWKIDPVHSSVRFSVNHWVIQEVVGQFNEYDATLLYKGGRLLVDAGDSSMTRE